MEKLNSETPTSKPIEYFYKHNRYFDFLKCTKIYKDIYKSKEAFVCVCLSLISTVFILYLVFFNPIPDSSDKLIDLLTLLIGSVIGLLGFLIGGLALIVGSIGSKLINVINESGKFVELLGIVYRFYFLGSILGAAVLIHLFSYLTLLVPLQFNFILTTIFAFLNSYAFFFSLTSSIMLMGSCIRLMILQYSLGK
ncbi:hypothetical protein VNN37_00265 [Lactococcus garvieae]|uniref:hypothetical protein n=1 Tax=Lactococcus garvieae TaxID=1363 RepID=UPI0030D23EE6